MDRRDFMRLVSAAAIAGGTFPLQTHGQSMPAGAGPWIALFNGNNLDGWDFFQEGVGIRDTTSAVTVHDGLIHMLGPDHRGGDAPGFGHIVTPREYGNYHLKVEYRFGEKRFEPRLLAKRNSGLLYHTFPERDRVWPNSVEFQFEESDVGDAICMNTRCFPGADQGGTPAWPNQAGFAQRPTFAVVNPRPPIERQRVIKNGNFERLGEWNTVELIAVGDKAAHLVNGRIVNSLYEITGQDVVDRNVYRSLTKGRIALELEGAEVFFRRVDIRLFS